MKLKYNNVDIKYICVNYSDRFCDRDDHVGCQSKQISIVATQNILKQNTNDRTKSQFQVIEPLLFDEPQNT